MLEWLKFWKRTKPEAPFSEPMSPVPIRAKQCRKCKKSVPVWHTYADGRILCSACAQGVRG